ncbi:MAG: DUF4392 domain-containing protein [Synergistaceae bacterium]|nr:DUF4392 domain-containing protein [Synergistaceae bacterium]
MKEYRIRQEVARRLTEITAGGRTGRGPSSLCADDVWSRALSLIGGRERVAVISGFYVPSASAPETDGPPGALVLARALRSLGHDAEVWTDSLCVDCFRACADSLGLPRSIVRDVSSGAVPSEELLIYVERLGRASDGVYYNMRGEDVTRWTAPLDGLASVGGTPVIAVGDGGNEVGMGSLRGPLSGIMRDYAMCLCSVEADVCIPVDVSNWGAYALVAALSSSVGKWLGQSEEEDALMLEALLESGAVDGVTRVGGMSVDGMDMEEHLKVRSELEKLVFAG